MKEMFEKVLEAYNEGDENKFVACVRNWVGSSEDNPFKKPEERQLFMEAKKFYGIWQSGAINCRVSKIRMVNRIRSLMELNPDNPYVATQEQVKKTKQVETIESTKENMIEEPKPVKHVFGVIPVDNEVKIETDEEPKKYFKRRKKE